MPYEIYVKNPEHNILMRVEESEEGSYIFNAKDLSLIEHTKEILDSGAIDSLKIEGRTKSDYYAGVVTKAYRDAIDDYYKDTFDIDKYLYEIETVKSRGYSDNYIVSKPKERLDTQNLATALSEGTHQVSGEVLEDEDYFMCKYKIFPNITKMEIVLPYNKTTQEIDNDIATISREDDRFFITFKKILTKNGKELEAVHSGNINPICLPIKLSAYTFFRYSLI
jgi:putative protease